ncbi:MAG TPA: 6-carboxytetrahydropterin synthase [Gammaproteobacteria bacterium]|nr:6-carboxytetrahydropterin synthase [Gammaproteobacteria bacterium]
MKPQLATIELFEERFSFSAAHFTIFSETLRERLHGHNYHVHALLTAGINEFGITFDYAIYKEKIFALCQQLKSYLLLPGLASALTIKEQGHYYYVYFNNEEMPFLKQDVLILPVRNITIEELAYWFLNQLIEDQATLTACNIHKITLKVSNGLGRYGSASWENC